MEIWFKVIEKSWKSHGNPLVKMCMNPVREGCLARTNRRMLDNITISNTFLKSSKRGGSSSLVHINTVSSSENRRGRLGLLAITVKHTFSSGDLSVVRCSDKKTSEKSMTGNPVSGFKIKVKC